MSTETRRLWCRNCGYHWDYSGRKIKEADSADYPVRTSCPRCGTGSVVIPKKVPAK
jgi:ribosomal protein S27AE